MNIKNALRIVNAALSGVSVDPTGGATHFLALDIMEYRIGKGKARWPDWAASDVLTTQIGRHAFYLPNERANKKLIAEKENWNAGYTGDPLAGWKPSSNTVARRLRRRAAMIGTLVIPAILLLGERQEVPPLARSLRQPRPRRRLSAPADWQGALV
jgi:hypothetical protein